MTDDIKKSLKEFPKLTKSYYKNGQQKSDYDHGTVLQTGITCKRIPL